ncbi:DUF4139 domain-containing protein [Pseudorhodoferax sp.]|uniref:DUF4139 domain-containing protein n=1 Tax=Pseudorhodoferax sp. TaxID=1993553 RepID=UPI0039E4BB63
MRTPLLVPLAASAVLAALPAAAADPIPSRIAEVTLYPGSATVQRVARVPAGSRQLRLDCLPAALDAQSLQVSAGAGVQLGETAVLTEDRAAVPACRDAPLDARIRDLEDRKAALQAEHAALDLVTGYLKGLGGGEARAADARAVAGVAEAVRRTGQDALARQHQLARAQAELDRELAPLLAERQRAQGRSGRVARVTVTLAAARDAELTLRYQLRGPGWTPAYRAQLDTATRRLRLERQALVAQSSGEDWRGVRLVLSTGQPLRAAGGREPAPWRVGLAAPPQAGAELRRLAAPAPAAMLERADAAGAPEAAEPAFEVQVDEQAFATEFRVPQPIDVPSDGQRVAVTLGQHEEQATLAVRTAPQTEAAAWLVAEFAPPPGIWPAGPLQLVRDGAFVGSTRWTPPQQAQASLSFGVDERVRVQAEPERDTQGSTGVFGGRAERRVQRAWTIENRHDGPVALQVLEAAPVAVDAQVRVQTEFAPPPAELEWQRRPGLVLWRTELAAGQSQRFTAGYRIDYPQDRRLEHR